MGYPWVRRIFYLVLAWYSISGVISELRATRKYRESLDWPRAVATIDSAQAYWINTSWHGYRHCAKLHYRYAVNGLEVKGSNQVFDFVCWPDGDTVVANHKPGTLIQIAYDPSAPDISIVPSIIGDPGIPWVDIVVGTGCVVLFLLDLSGFWPWLLARRSRDPKHRRRRAHSRVS